MIESNKILSGNMLKGIALLTMIIDHIGMVFFWDSILLRLIGRLSFPLFAFLLCEGFAHTSSKEKYMVRLGVFALLSEIPYDLALFGEVSLSNQQNIFFTLLCGAMTLYVCEKYQTWIFGMMGMVAGELLSVDYGSLGVMLIVLLWYYRKGTVEIFSSLSLFVVTLMCVEFGQRFPLSPSQWPWWLITLGVLPSGFLMMRYNGERGNTKCSPALIQWGGYLFYPAHLWLFWIISEMI